MAGVSCRICSGYKERQKTHAANQIWVPLEDLQIRVGISCCGAVSIVTRIRLTYLGFAYISMKGTL